MAAFVKSSPRLAVVGSGRPAPLASTLICTWEISSQGGLVRRWRAEPEPSRAFAVALADAA